ncbi:MAG TPA: U32 family peptidase [Candidatus Onthousia faecavium]|nr:U32 family peptidase [Candidatus Onthousia faecavium]
MAKVELLAPAGDLERLKVTLLYGADAVYVGGEKYSLRANAVNFTLEELKEGCTFAHKLGKKVYLTANIVFHEQDKEDYTNYFKDIVDCGIDAFIVSDLALAKYLIDTYKDKEIHISTQDSVTNLESAKFYRDLGAKRVVLARELSKEEIKEISSLPNLDTEVFIHGAMCTCVSGRCTLSNYVTNRDANRGGCAQVCRFAFDSSLGDTFSLATKDLNLALYIKDLIEIGVTSLKVEGRMRSLYYLATVIGSYRYIIDNIYNNTLTEENLLEYKQRLDSVANRETTSQYFTHEADVTDQYYTGRQEISNQEYLGLIIGYDEETKSIILKERNYFKVGDLVEIFTPEGDIYPYEITTILNEDNEPISVARHPEEILKLPFAKKLSEYSMIRLIKKG